MEIVDRFHGVGFGEKAKRNSKKYLQKRYSNGYSCVYFETSIWICQALVDSKLVDSTSQARRDIKQMLYL